MDPMLNLGLVSQDEATRVLRDEADFSAAMVKQEIDRYTLRNPGQAGSYFYGCTRLLQLRTETELALGPRVNRLKCNAFVLGQGLWPQSPLFKAFEGFWESRKFSHLIIYATKKSQIFKPSPTTKLAKNSSA